VRAALGRRRPLLLRVGDAAQPRGYAVSQWVDRVVTVVRGHRVPPTFGRTAGGPGHRAAAQRGAWAFPRCDKARAVPHLLEPGHAAFANVLLVTPTSAAHARRPALLYTFEVSDSGGIRLADGRATVVLNTPAILPGQAASASVGGTT
jgi:hypothetical protein